MCRQWIYVACLLILSSMFQPGVTRAADPAFVGWWKLDETGGIVAHDSSGYANDGILYGNPQWGGGGLRFDGDGDYVDCGNDASLNLTGDVTIAAWIRLDGPAADRKIAGNQDNITGGYKFGVYADKLEFEIRTAANRAVLNRSVSGGSPIEPNVYHHVVGVYSQGRFIRTYIDGVLDRELATAELLGASTGTFKLGREPFSDAYFWLGLMDDVRVYGRALTSPEIEDLVSPPQQAHAPNPPDGATDVSSPLVSWEPGEEGVCYNVYFGVHADLTEADLVAVCSPTSIYYHMAGFEPNTTYCWRIDEVHADGTVVRGNVWCFTTGRPVGTAENPIRMVLAPTSSGTAVRDIGERIAEVLRAHTDYHIETVPVEDIDEMIDQFTSGADVFGFPASGDYPRLYERTDGRLSLRLIATYADDSPLAGAGLSDCLCFGPGFPQGAAERLAQAVAEHIATEEGRVLWSDERFYGWTGVLDARLWFLDSLHAAAGLPVSRISCSSYTPQSPATPPEHLVSYMADPMGDYLIDHPMFAELYDVQFERNIPIPPTLDITEVAVESDGESHTFHIRTAAPGLVQEIQNPQQRVTFGVYIDKDGDGIADVILTTAESGRRSVLLTRELLPIDGWSDLTVNDDAIHLTLSEQVVGPTFDWTAFSGYSPYPDAAYVTTLTDVFVVPDVDIVASVDGGPAILSFLEGPGTCQISDKVVFACCGGTCTISASIPVTTIPGTTQTGKLFFRKQCGTKIYEFWCSGCCFGSRVYGGGTTGWVGRCPFTCGLNSVNVWSQGAGAQLDKVYHSIKDGDCINPVTGAPAPHDGDGDSLRDSMVHTYVYATDLVESCNVERDEATNAIVAQRCCPPRMPYANLLDVPGSINSTASCPTSAP